MRSINRTIELVGAHQERVNPEVRAQIEEKNNHDCKRRMGNWLAEYVMECTMEPVTLYGLDADGNITTRQFSTFDAMHNHHNGRRG